MVQTARYQPQIDIGSVMLGPGGQDVCVSLARRGTRWDVILETLSYNRRDGQITIQDTTAIPVEHIPALVRLLQMARHRAEAQMYEAEPGA